MRSIFILISFAFVLTASGQRAGTDLPVHSIHSGFYTTTSGAHTGFFIDYQYYVDDLISYSVKPGAAWLSKNDTITITNYFLFAGINYRVNALRKPLRERPFNSQPYVGFYPLTFEYIDNKQVEEAEAGQDHRLGFVPSGIIGYTLIFINRIDLDMHAGFGVSFRMSGKGGNPVEPVAFAGIGLGVRF